MAASIILFAGAAKDLIVEGITPNDPFIIEEISVTTPHGTGSINLAKKITIPSHSSDRTNHPKESILIADSDVTLNPWKLKTWSAVQADIKALRDSADVVKAAIAEAERDTLRDALSNVPIELSAPGSAFFGLNGLPLVGGGTFEAHLGIDLASLDPGTDEIPFLTATLSVTGQVTTPAGNVDAAARFEVELTRNELVKMLPSISIHPLPRFPPLDLQWPKIGWPELNWPALGPNLSGLSKLFRFDLPIPKLNLGKSPLWIRWTAAPQFQLAINGQKRLEISTVHRGNGTLVCETEPTGNYAADIAAINDVGFTLDANGTLSLSGTVAPAAPATFTFPPTVIEKPDALPFKIELLASSLKIQVPAVDLSQPTAVAITATLDVPNVVIRAKNDPALLIALHATYAQTFDAATGETAGKLTVLEIVQPYPVKLVALAAQEADDLKQALVRFVSAIHIQGPDVPDLSNVLKVLDRIVEMIAAAVRWLAHQGGSAAGSLLGVAEAVGEVLAKWARMLCEAIKGLGGGGAGVALIVEVRLDARTYALRQIVITPAWVSAPAGSFSGEELGLSVDIPLDWQPVLVIDLDGSPSVALLVVPPKESLATLGTDLWLARDAGVEAVRDTDAAGQRPARRLIQVSAQFTQAMTAIALIRLSGSKAHFLQSCAAKISSAPITPPPGTSLPPGLKLARITGAITYENLDWSTVDLKIQAEIDRLLPFLQSSKQSAAQFIDTLGQYIKVTAKKPASAARNGVFALPISVTLTIKDMNVDFDLNVNIDIKDFSVRLSGGDKVQVFGEEEFGKGKKDFSLLGLKGNIVLKAPRSTDWPDGKFPFFGLDFSRGDVRLSLAPEARLELTYGQVASGGRGIVFHVDELGISRSGLDLSGKVDRDTPVQLAGVDMPFRFDGGGLSIKNSQIQAFSIRGAGQLPPELVGEANATISISMGKGSDGSLIVQSAEAKLDKANDPIVCHATRFVLTISALGLEFQNFTSEGAGYHFYFTLTGTAVFQPREGEFSDGLLKYLGSITITLDKAPLARDPSMLLRAISFQVAVVPAKRFNFFNLFNFELRGIGFHPSSPAFAGKPALSISGQVNFVEAGDIVSPRIDFHELWIAPPKAGQSLPQVRFDGLTLGIRFGGAASIEGTAMTVDDTLPSLYTPGALPKDVTVHGFLASGKLTIKGWGAMSAAMGFLELRKQDGDLRQAFFLYGEADDLSIEIPTPVGPIYLREVGFGFGYRFTLAAFNRADQVTNVKDLIKVLDDISKYQGNLASVKSWEPEADGNRVTLALRGLITVESASGESEYNAAGEKELPNPILFDIVAALRSDFTFFLNARVWIARNYADWHDSSANDPWRNNPTLRGYVYLSVPRKEFLGRLIADGTGDVDGTHPKLPAPLVKAMKGIRWSATTYIRPGLFHQEFGWPYELGFTFEEKQGGGSFQIVCQGGLINRIEDGAMLYGIAFRARGFAQFGGQIGGRSFGASAVARADFSIDAKFIAYISVKRFSDTLFYGSIAFDISISLQVRIWLEFSVGFTDIHLEVGFSVSLTISIALEAAATPSSIAARGSASVGVGAFGRHIRLGIAFAVNPGRLDEARARVERFMQLGLTVAMPDAEKGIAPPMPELPRGPRAGDADHAADTALDKHDAVTAPTPGALPTAQGRPLQPTGYWAVLFPVVGTQAMGNNEQFVMVFVPRDHTETGLSDQDLPTKNSDGELLGTFYPPPFGKRTNSEGIVVDGPNANALQITLEQGQVGFSIDRFKSTGGIETASVSQAAPLLLQYDFSVVVARSQDKKDETITLDNFLTQCFVIRDKNQTTASLGEPWAKQISADPERLPVAREVAAQVLTDAGRDQLALGLEERAANDIEERRSAAIASLCDSGANLAASSAAWEQKPAEGIDARSFGIAFMVTRSQIATLFPSTATASDNKPRTAIFQLRATDTGTIKPLDKNVHLFNPPDRMFREGAPRLADPVIEATANGIRLDWDLEPAFGATAGVWNDPEFNLKHYRIERIVTPSDSLNSPYKPMRTTTKAAGPMRLVRDPVSANFVWRFVRPNAQFVDDLSDLPDALRRAILPASNIPVTAPTGSAALIPEPPYVLRYTVVPIDTAGTAGPPTPLMLQITRSKPVSTGVSRAVLHVEYHGSKDQIIADVTAANSVTPTFTLGIDDAADNPPRTDLGAGRTYLIRVRKERSVPIGLYGSDAVSDARARPSAADFNIKRPTDRDFVVKLTKGVTAGGTVQWPSFDDPIPVIISSSPQPGYTIDKDLDHSVTFAQAIGACRTPQDRLDNGPIGVRFAIQRVGAQEDFEPAPWCPMDVTILMDIRGAGATEKLPAVAAPVEVFEHPVGIDSAPLLSEDLDGAAGRVVTLHPAEDATLAQLIGSKTRPQDKSPLRRLRDGARRVATKVQWNARPAAAETLLADRSAMRTAPYFGGYDIFEIDVSGEAEGATSAPVALALHYPFSNSVLDSDPGDALRLHVLKDGTIYAILVGGDQSSALDRLQDSGDTAKGQVRLIQVDNPANALTFDFKFCVRARGYRKLVVERRHEAALPFVDGKMLVLFFTCDPPAKHVARVQALPAPLAQLDPAEIIDFAKTEAHYPSETVRLLASTAASEAPLGNSWTSRLRARVRQGAWYSPAESFLVWPGRTLRRSLAINVDEPTLTELLSNGRPERISVELTINGELHSKALRPLARGDQEFSPQTGYQELYPQGVTALGGWTAGALRELLQSLVWNSYDRDIRTAFKVHPDQFHNARITVRALKASRQAGQPDIVLSKADWQIDLDPPLHPVLADIIDFSRYETGSDRTLRYPWLKLAKENADAIQEWLLKSTTRIGPFVRFSISDWVGPIPKPALGFQIDRDFNFPSLAQAVEFRIDPPRGTLPSTPDEERQRVVKLIMSAIRRLALKLDSEQVDQLSREPVLAKLTVDLVVQQNPPALDPQPFEIEKATSPGPRYRRYEPVLEQLPKIGAKDVAGWFDETPVQRDPYGWGIMRSLGLAAGLKLYDTEKRDYLTPKETLKKLQGAFEAVLPRYPHDNVGSPFVDVITHAGGTMSLASFDGGLSGVVDDEVKALLSDKALALVQISLRPTVDRFAKAWVPSPDERGWIHQPIEKVVAYFAIQAKAASDGSPIAKVQIDLDKLNPAVGLVAIAEIIDLTTGLAKPPIVTLIPTAGTDDAVKLQREAMLDGTGEQHSLIIDAGKLKPGETVAIARVTVNKGDAAVVFGQSSDVTSWVVGGNLKEISGPADTANPFGRFPDMTARRFGALAGQGGHPALLDAIDGFRSYALRRLPDGWPNATQKPTLVARIPEWTRRFFDHGPPSEPDLSQAPLFAIAEVTRPDPWRVGVAADGTMEVLFSHDDRKRRLKRYAVRPFGRYDAFADALTRADAPDVSPRPPRLGGAWSDTLADGADVQQKFEDNWSRRFLDVVIPRTEPLAPPVLIDARRIEILPPVAAADKAPRKVLEFLYARHPEEILSEANIIAEGALSFETVSFGFWREFPMQCWANDIQPHIDTSQEFGSWDRRPAPFKLIESSDQFGGLAQSPTLEGTNDFVAGRYTDGWRGTLALRTESLPFFFRTHVAAFASAGVVVSEPVIATIEEGHYQLTLPWTLDPQAKSDDLNVTTPPPDWSVTRQSDGPNPGIWVTFGIPLARLFDSMLQDSRKIWLQANAIPDVFMLPDPVARYEIAVVAMDDVGLSAVSAEIDIIGQQRAVTPPSSGAVTVSGYRMNLVGPLFDPSSPSSPRLERRSDNGKWWKLYPSVLVKDDRNAPSVKFDPSIPSINGGDQLRGFVLEPEDFGADKIWPSLAPTTAVELRVHVPGNNVGWPAFTTAVKTWQQVFERHKAIVGAREIWGFLDMWAGTKWPPPSSQPTKFNTPAFAAGLPWPPTTLPPDVSMTQVSGWMWPSPPDVGIAQRENVRAINNEEFKAWIRDPVCMEMRRVQAARDESKSRFLNYSPLTTVLRPDAIGEAAYDVAIAQDQAGAFLLPTCIDVIVAIPVTLDPNDPDMLAKVKALVKSVEANSFTATAILDLGALEDSRAAAAEVHLPCHALADPEVATKLAAVDAAAMGKLRVWSLLLRRAPDDAERKKIMAAIDDLITTSEIATELKRLVDRSIANQIFGAGRSPRIKVYRGTSAPQQDLIERA